MDLKKLIFCFKKLVFFGESSKQIRDIEPLVTSLFLLPCYYRLHGVIITLTPTKKPQNTDS